jgi:hypothetical protein
VARSAERKGEVAFNYPGSDGRLQLVDSWLDGTFSFYTDFPFSIAGRTFEKLFVLVDGIYPELARFVKTFSELVGQNAKRFSKWQESSRKDIERAFGVLQRKFHIIVRSFEQWYVEDISDIVVSCIVLHNMMSLTGCLVTRTKVWICTTFRRKKNHWKKTHHLIRRRMTSIDALQKRSCTEDLIRSSITNPSFPYTNNRN